MALQYIASSNADTFILKTLLSRNKPKTFLDKLKYVIIGERNHQWMYDGTSLVHLLTLAGFKDARLMPAGSTMIPEPGELDLYEHESESVYVEAYNV